MLLALFVSPSLWMLAISFPSFGITQGKAALSWLICFRVEAKPVMHVVIISLPGPNALSPTCYRGLQACGAGTDVHICQLCEADMWCCVSTVWRCAHGCPWSPRTKRTIWTTCESPISCMKINLKELKRYRWCRHRKAKMHASLDIKKMFCHGKQWQNMHHTSHFSKFLGPS